VEAARETLSRLREAAPQPVLRESLEEGRLLEGQVVARRSDGAVGPPRVVAQEPELVGVTRHPVVAASDNGHGAVEQASASWSASAYPGPSVSASLVLLDARASASNGSNRQCSARAPDSAPPVPGRRERPPSAVLAPLLN